MARIRDSVAYAAGKVAKLVDNILDDVDLVIINRTGGDLVEEGKKFLKGEIKEFPIGFRLKV